MSEKPKKPDPEADPEADPKDTAEATAASETEARAVEETIHGQKYSLCDLSTIVQK